MNTILALILSFAMLFSGGALPETAETASTLAIQDFILEYDGESYPLGLDFYITASAAQDGLTLHFEAKAEDGEILLPMSGKVTPEGVTFALAEDGKAYCLNAETIDQEIELTEEDKALFEKTTRYIEEYAALLAHAEQNKPVAMSEEDAQAIMDTLYNNLSDLVTEETTWDFGEGEIPAVRIAGRASIMDLYNVVDQWMALDIESLSPILRQVLDLYSSIFSMAVVVEDMETVMPDKDEAASIGVIGGADGPTSVYVAGEEGGFKPAESYVELLEILSEGDEEMLRMFEETEIEMEFLNAMDGDTRYENVSFFSFLDEESGAMLNMNMEMVSSPESTLLYCAAYVDSDEGSNGLELQLGMEGPAESPDAMDMVMMVQGNSSEFYDEDGKEVEEFYTNAGMITVSSTFDGELTDTDFTFELSENIQRYEDGEFIEETYSDPVYMSFSMDQEQDEEGLFTAFEMGMEDEGKAMGASFSTLLSEGPAEDFFEGLEVLEVTEENAEEFENSLSADSLSLMSDAMAIAATENFMALSDLFTNEIFAGPAVDVANVDYIQYDSLEDATAAFAGEFPVYNAPEGYELENVNVYEDGSYLGAKFVSENGPDFEMNSFYYEYGNADNSFMLKDGELVETDGPIVTLASIEDGTYYNVVLTLDNCTISVFFTDDSATLEEVEAILSGLEI